MNQSETNETPETFSRIGAHVMTHTPKNQQSAHASRICVNSFISFISFMLINKGFFSFV